MKTLVKSEEVEPDQYRDFTLNQEVKRMTDDFDRFYEKEFARLKAEYKSAKAKQ